MDPKIVTLDLESIPNLKEVMRIFPSLGDYPGLTLKATINSIICFGYKINNEPAKVVCAWDFPDWWEKDKNDDSLVLLQALEILKDADLIVTHNGKRFDLKFIQTRLMAAGLPPLPRIHHVDTCQLAKANLLFFNNRLGTLSKFLLQDDKMDHDGWKLWISVSEKDPAAMQLMSEYCAKDVELTYQLFQRLKPFAKNIPNYNHFTETKANVCPNCGSTLIKKNGHRYTATAKTQRYECTQCYTGFSTNTKDEMPRTL